MVFTSEVAEEIAPYYARDNVSLGSSFCLCNIDTSYSYLRVVDTQLSDQGLLEWAEGILRERRAPREHEAAHKRGELPRQGEIFEFLRLTGGVAGDVHDALLDGLGGCGRGGRVVRDGHGPGVCLFLLRGHDDRSQVEVSPMTDGGAWNVR